MLQWTVLLVTWSFGYHRDFTIEILNIDFFTHFDGNGYPENSLSLFLLLPFVSLALFQNIAHDCFYLNFKEICTENSNYSYVGQNPNIQIIFCYFLLRQASTRIFRVECKYDKNKIQITLHNVSSFI